MPVFLLLTLASSVFSHETSLLALDQPLEREIKGGEKHVFAVIDGAGETRRGIEYADRI